METIAANNAHHSHTADAAADAASESAPADEALRDASDPAASSSDWVSIHSATPPSSLDLEIQPPIHDVMATLARRDGRSPGRRMDDEAIAGTAVGVILAVALMVCCIYPVAVHYIKKRRRNKRLPFDCEYGNYRGQPVVLQRRLSSSDTIKREDGGKERGYNYQDSYANGQSRPSPTRGYDASAPDAIEPAMAQGYNYYSNFPYYYQDVIPASAAPQQIVLKGTSEDYYCPHIPSEAFGMFPEPECDTPTQPERTSKRVSLKNNVRCLFRRKGTFDQTMNSPTSAPYSDQPAPEVPSQDLSQVQQFFTTYETSQSPTEFSPMNLDTPYDSPSCAFGTPDEVPCGYQSEDGVRASQTPPNLRLCTSPNEPAPGTVNPMDIMPASTESERWHCTDYQLYTSFESPEARSSSTEIPFTENIPMIATPSPPHYLASPSQNHQITLQHGPDADPQSAAGREPMTLKVQPANTTLKTASSRPLPGPSSTNASTLSGTPSTHDSPSPVSMNSSDCGHHSASPHDGVGIPSPKGGLYACDEPGCHQTFDQPHKLK